MKRMVTRILWGTLLLLFLWGDVSQAEAAEAFRITNYVVTVQVSQDNVYHIQEDIAVFFDEARHGIYRDIPVSYTVSREDGSSNKVRAKVSNVSCSDPCKTSRSGGDYRLQIGDEDQTQYGDKSYSISYDLSVGKDPLKDKDEFYYNIIGTGWDTTISNVTFSVIMPSTIDQEKVGLSYGHQGATLYDGLQYQINDNMMAGYLDPSIVLQPGQGLTVRMELPDGYFTYHPEFPLDAVTSIVMVTLAMLAAFVLWHYYGKDDPVVETIEFHPPAALNSLETALAYKGEVDGEDVVSLIVYLAGKGYLRIEETSKGDFLLRKMKEYDGNNKVERIFFNSLFATRDFVTKSDLKNKFYKTINKITHMMNSQRNSNVLFYENSTNKDTILVLMAIASVILSLYHPILEINGSVAGAIVTSGLVGSILVIVMRALMKPGKIFAKIYLLLWAIGFLGISGSIIIFQGFIYADPIYRFASVYGLVGCVEIMFFRHYMPKRTDYGNRILGYLQGFREFLQTAEKDRLEALVEEDPQYFYSILPYTYVLGVSDKWMRKFESIAMEPPEWYYSSRHTAFHMTSFQRSMNQTMKAANSAMTSSPSSGGHGGGGHSGGGHGGGGGGSW